MKHELTSKPLFRYVFAGGIAYVIEIAFLAAFHKLFGLSVEASTAIAFWIGLTTSFVLQKFVAFKDYQKTLKAISRQVGAYACLILVNYVFTLAVVSLFPSRLIIVSRTLALIATTVWNYFLYKHVIFKTGPQHKHPGLTFAQIKAKIFSKQGGLYLGMTLVVFTFFWQYWGTGSHKSFGGDFDYYSQMYEALRISVWKYHQFPLWNPWLSGGVPLFSNPQFGLFSLQSVMALIFGGIYGLKLAFCFYGIAGFWGMYALGRRVLGASQLRSALVSYIWVFSGFFAGHGVWHFTFTSFFLLPWLLYFIARRKEKYSWLGLGLVESAIILSSIHYAFLMLTFALGLYFIISLGKISWRDQKLALHWELLRTDIAFGARAVATVAVLAGYQLFQTYRFVAGNQRLTSALTEPPNTLGLFIKSLFLPIGTFIKTYPKTTWGWGEYSMYIGMGTGIALLVCLVSAVTSLRKKDRHPLVSNRVVVVSILLVGLLGAWIALGNYGHSSAFYLIHMLPGFTQTRTPTRWLILATFSLLILLLAWHRNHKIVNGLLLVSAVELFLMHGPPRTIGQNQYVLPAAQFSNTFQQYDNDKKHIGMNGSDSMQSYYYATEQNIGQIYADDSLINTLSSFDPPILTRRCGINKSPDCSFVMTHNATVTYWSPNKIIVKRTGPGAIELNMNVEAGWRINDIYPFTRLSSLEPTRQFVLPPGTDSYTIEYAPRFSPAWVSWHLEKL